MRPIVERDVDDEDSCVSVQEFIAATKDKVCTSVLVRSDTSTEPKEQKEGVKRTMSMSRKARCKGILG